MVVMGQISAPYGIKGWVKIRPFTDALDSLLDFQSWWMGSEGSWRRIEVFEASLHGKSIVASIEGCPDRNVAERLKGQQIAVPRSALPETGEDEYYWADLVGLKVVNLEGVELGRIENIIGTGANDVLEVRDGKIRLIPFVKRHVLEVDLDAKLVRVDWGVDY